MARAKNIEKRNDILKIAYRMFCEKGYEQVFIREIAAGAGISKALVQHYFAKKSDILEVMLQEILEVSFTYVSRLLPEQKSLYLKLSVYANLFFEAVIRQDDLRRFIENIIADKALLKLWINIVHQWLTSIQTEEIADVPQQHFQIALTFAMAGGTELLLQQEALVLPVAFIAEQMLTSFMRILNNSPESAELIIAETEELLHQFSFGEFNDYCRQEIFWYE